MLLASKALLSWIKWAFDASNIRPCTGRSGRWEKKAYGSLCVYHPPSNYIMNDYVQFPIILSIFHESWLNSVNFLWISFVFCLFFMKSDLFRLTFLNFFFSWILDFFWLIFHEFWSVFHFPGVHEKVSRASPFKRALFAFAFEYKRKWAKRGFRCPLIDKVRFVNLTKSKF